MQVVTSKAYSNCFVAFIITIVGFRFENTQKNLVNFPKNVGSS